MSGWSDNTTETGVASITTNYVLTKVESEGDFDLDFSATETLAPSTFVTSTTENGGAGFTNFLGRFSNTGSVQGPNRTFTLPGTQEITTITLDVYEIDTWDITQSENIYFYIDDVLVYTLGPLWVNDFDTVQGDIDTSPKRLSYNLSTSLANFGFGGWFDQKYQFVFQVSNPGSTSIKIGFGGRTNEGFANEAWGIDNLSVVTHDIATVAAVGSCSNASEFYYDASLRSYVFCTGSDLISFSNPNTGSGGCSSPTAVEGALDYDAANNIYRFCDDGGWVEISNEGHN